MVHIVLGGDIDVYICNVGMPITQLNINLINNKVHMSKLQ